MVPGDVADLGRRLRRGEATAEAVLDAHLGRIREADGAVAAVWELTEARAREAARRADRTLAEGGGGPLLGIPFLVKDTADMAGLSTTCGSAAMAGRVAEGDAAVVRLLCGAGAVPLGKVATYDLGTVGPSFDLPRPPARNPWDLSRITGGSSSGSAAAVAAGFAPIAVGSDTAGSIRAPAAYCGCVGLKPTRGLVLAEGVFSLAPTLLDTVGPLARTAACAAAFLDAVAGTAALAEVGRGAAGLRVGYARGWAEAPEAAPWLLLVLDDAVAALSLAGAEVAEVAPPDYALLEAVGALLIHTEGLAIHREAMRSDLPHGRESYKSLAAGVVLSPQDREAALALAPRLAAEVDRALLGREALVTATTLTPALPMQAFREGSVWTPMRTLPFNVTGHPAVSVPMGFVGGLPLGLQVVARRGEDATALRVAAAFEAATDHALRRPPLPGREAWERLGAP